MCTVNQNISALSLRSTIKSFKIDLLNLPNSTTTYYNLILVLYENNLYFFRTVQL